MATNISRQGSKGGDPGYDTSQLRGVREERGIITGVVKANVHPTHMGVIKIWSSTFSTDENDKSQWRSVRYCSPFYSRVDNSGVGDTYFGVKNPSGIVTPPPDLGTKVLAFFPEGRNSEGYYFACVPDTYMMQTLPEATTSGGVASGEFNDSPAGKHPGAKITNWRTQERPEDFFTQNNLVQSGLSTDPIRGLSTSGYMRESPSEVIGIASKGRRITTDGQDFTVTNNAAIKNPSTADKTILQGLLGPTARRKGHSITLDDGDVDGNSNQVRLRTSTGHQILMNDTEGVIYISSGDGSCWIELSEAGTMDVYAADSINFRSRNLQFHADENIKFHSKGYTQVIADQQLHLQGTGELSIITEGEAGINAKKNLHLYTESELFATSQGASYYNAAGNISVAGAMVLLQGPKTQAKQAKKVENFDKEDTTYNEDLDQFILDEEQMVTTSVDRLAMHEPFLYHGVPNTTTAYSGGLGGASGQTTSNYGIVPASVTSPSAATSPTAVAGGASPAAAATGGSQFSGLAGDPNIQAVLAEAGVSPQQLQDQIGSMETTMANLDTSKLTVDGTGKITGLKEFQASLPSEFSGMPDIGSLGGGAQLPSNLGSMTSMVPSIPDNLGNVLSAPNLTQFPVTDLIAQANTGFSVGALDSFDVQGLNAAVVKQVGSLNNPAFIDSATKSVGKFGFNVDQLKNQGFVRPEAVFNDQLADPGVWTGKAGANSLNKFLANSPLQESVQQGVIADEYQQMVNSGAINFADGKKEVMSMLSASNMSSPEIAAQARKGFAEIEKVLPNTTNIPTGEDVSSKVQQAMQTGAAASERVEQARPKAASVPDGTTPTRPSLTSTTPVTTPVTTTTTTTTTVTGGESTTTTTPVTGGQVTTGTAYTPSDDLLDSTAESDAQEQANIDAFNAEPITNETETSDDDPYGFQAEQDKADAKRKTEFERNLEKKRAEEERRKSLKGYAKYKDLKDQAKALRSQYFGLMSVGGEAAFNKRKALKKQIQALLAQADAALESEVSNKL